MSLNKKGNRMGFKIQKLHTLQGLKLFMGYFRSQKF